jgi:hypothetical protein
MFNTDDSAQLDQIVILSGYGIIEVAFIYPIPLFGDCAGCAVPQSSEAVRQKFSFS